MIARIAVVLRPVNLETFRTAWESDTRYWIEDYQIGTEMGDGELRYYYEVRQAGFLYPLFTSLTGNIGVAIERTELISADIVIDRKEAQL